MEHVFGKKIKKNIKVVMGDPNLVEEDELFLGYDDNGNPALCTKIAGVLKLIPVAEITNYGQAYFTGNLGEVAINEMFGSEEFTPVPGGPISEHPIG